MNGNYKLISLLILLSFLVTDLPGQEEIQITCPSDDEHHRLLQTDQKYKERYDYFGKLYRNRIRNSRSEKKARTAPVYTIPVVVHIIHEGDALGSVANPTDDQVEAIIEQASQRFRHVHNGAQSYSNPLYGVDTEIELCLTGQDEQGNYTSGVTRHYNPDLAIGSYSDIANDLNQQFAWDQTKYCNLFVVKTLTDAAGVYIGGYDFTIYDSGSFWSGLVAHEIGHYFNLRHTFSGGCANNTCDQDGDEVCDTPPKSNSGFTGSGCSSPGNSCTTDDDDLRSINPYRPIGNGGIGDQVDMLENYMDYTGSCWDAFTEGQKVRMRTDIEVFRTALVNHATSCNSPDPSLDVAITQVAINQNSPCELPHSVSINVHNIGTTTITSLIIQIWNQANLIHSEQWTGNISSDSQGDIMLNQQIPLPKGMNLLQFKAVQPNGSQDQNQYNDSWFGEVTYLGSMSCNTRQECVELNSQTDLGVSTQISIDQLYATQDLVQICVTTEGDIGAWFEVFQIIDENSTVRALTNSGDDCNGPSPASCFVVEASDYSTWMQDGILELSFQPVSNEINPNLCITSQICVTVYSPEPADCQESIVLSGPISSGYYLSSQHIDISGSITPSMDVTLNAKDYIDILFEFEVNMGGMLQVLTDGCDP